MSLFKYLSAKYADALVSRGSLRIGTLYGFRDGEKFDEERADRLEGVRQYVGRPEFDSARDVAATDYLRRNAGLDIQGGVFINLAGGPAFVNEAVAKDCYIYCTTEAFDESNLSSMDGACVEINDPSVFFGLIDEQLLNRGLVKGRHSIAACVYCSKQEYFEHDKPGKPPGWIVKPANYAHQREVRAMWVPTKETDLQGTLKSSFYKYVTLDAETIEVPALVGSACLKRVR